MSVPGEATGVRHLGGAGNMVMMVTHDSMPLVSDRRAPARNSELHFGT